MENEIMLNIPDEANIDAMEEIAVFISNHYVLVAFDSYEKEFRYSIYDDDFYLIDRGTIGNEDDSLLEICTDIIYECLDGGLFEDTENEWVSYSDIMESIEARNEENETDEEDY